MKSYNTSRSKNSFLIAILCISFIVLSCQNSNDNSKSDSKAPPLDIEKYMQAPNGEKTWETLRGKAVVLEFWATWCAPCIAQIPHLNELVTTFKNDPVEFISITDENESVVRPFLKDRPMKGWIGLDTDRSLFNDYDVITIPKTVLVYPNGKIAAVTRANKVTEKTIKNLIQGKELSIKNINQTTDQKNLGENSSQSLVDIKVLASKDSNSHYLLDPNNGKLNAKSIRVANALRIAHNISSVRVKGPKEVLNQQLAIEMSLPSEKTDQFRIILQEALDSKLNLKSSRQSIETDALILTAPEEENGLRSSKSDSYHSSSTQGALAASYATLDDLASTIEYILEQPVINKTDLKGRFDWTVEFDKDNPRSVIKAVENKLNLNLTSTNSHVEFLVVETQY